MRPALRPGRRSAGTSPATPRELLLRTGRLLLWLAVIVVLVRGLAAIATAQRAVSARPGPSGAQAGAGWPDDTARAFAVEFATAYLTHVTGEDPGEYTRRVESYASADLAGQLAPTFDRGAPAAGVQAATVAGAARLDARHALITVAVTLTTGGRVTRWLSVPIARDGAGGVVVDDLPSFVAPPRRASGRPVQGDPLVGPDSGPIGDVVTRFLRAYLAGDTGALWYLAAPGARIATSAGGLRLLEVSSIELAAVPSPGGRLLLLVMVRARDLAGRVVYGLRYQVRLVRRDRWYVAAINGPAREG